MERNMTTAATVVLLVFALCGACPAAAAQSGYAAYDLRITTLMERQNELFDSALGAMQKLSLASTTADEATAAIQELKGSMARVNRQIHQAACEKPYRELHQKYIAFSDHVMEVTDALEERARAYSPASEDDVRVFLTSTVKDAFEVSRKNIEILYAIREILKKEDFSREKEETRQFYRWQRSTLPIDIYVLGNFIEAHLYITMMFADESTIRAGAENLRILVSLVDKDVADVKAKIEGVEPPPCLQELHASWASVNLKTLGFFVIAKSLCEADSRELFGQSLEKLGRLSIRVTELMNDMDRRTINFMRENI